MKPKKYTEIPGGIQIEETDMQQILKEIQNRLEVLEKKIERMGV